MAMIIIRPPAGPAGAEADGGRRAVLCRVFWFKHVSLLSFQLSFHHYFLRREAWSWTWTSGSCAETRKC